MMDNVDGFSCFGKAKTPIGSFDFGAQKDNHEEIIALLNESSAALKIIKEQLQIISARLGEKLDAPEKPAPAHT